MLIFIIFGMTDLFITAIFMAIYGRKPSYSDGMLLGVHIPEYEVKNPEVEALMERYTRKSKKFYMWNLIASVAVCLLSFWYFSIFMIVWSLRLGELVGGAMWLQCRAHRKLYDLKVERGWQGHLKSGIVVVDTCVTAESEKLPFSIWWHIPVLLGLAGMFFMPVVRGVLGKFPELWIFIGAGGAVFLIFVALHSWTIRSRNEVVSEDTSMNQHVNQFTKRVWSAMWIGVDYLNLLSVIAVFYYCAKSQWMSGLGIAWFIGIQSLAGCGILAGVFYLRWKKRDILKEDSHRIYVDDDVYWKNGWYNNPADPKLWVPDRINTMNYSTNMGRAAGKVFTIGTFAAVAVLLIVLFAVFLEVDFTPRYLAVEGMKIRVSSPMSPIQFEREDIENVELLDELPKGDFTRTNGLADDRQLVGEFREKEIGECRVYIYRDQPPILKIELPEYTVFVNSEEAGEVEKWYNELR